MISAYPARPAKILIVDDHPLVREGLRLRISSQADLTVCGEAATEEEALALTRKTGPDLLVVDLCLKAGHGLDLIKQLHSRHPQVRMLVLSGFDESLYAERALRAGALGYLNKQESNERLLEAIRTVLKGQRFVSENLAQRLVAQALGDRESAKEPITKLTNRELEIFRMIGQGMTSGAIANALRLSTHTIDSHRENIKRKLGAKNAGELTRQAMHWLLDQG
jgi:DNA-binding NarL/FixJ family response regulator